MGWARFDDRRHENVKLRKAGLEADALDVRGITYAAGHETDGWLDEAIVQYLAGVGHWRNLADTLVDVGRWRRDDEAGGWWIHDYLAFNPAKKDLDKRRKEDRERKAAQTRNDDGTFRPDSKRNPRGSRKSSNRPDPARPGFPSGNRAGHNRETIEEVAEELQ